MFPVLNVWKVKKFKGKVKESLFTNIRSSLYRSSSFHQVQRKHVYDIRQSLLTGDNESCSQHIFQWVPFHISWLLFILNHYDIHLWWRLIGILHEWCMKYFATMLRHHKVFLSLLMLFFKFHLKNIVCRYMQAVVDEIVFANADPLKVVWIFSYRMFQVFDHKFIILFGYFFIAS